MIVSVLNVYPLFDANILNDKISSWLGPDDLSLVGPTKIVLKMSGIPL